MIPYWRKQHSYSVFRSVFPLCQVTFFYNSINTCNWPIVTFLGRFLETLFRNYNIIFQISPRFYLNVDICSQIPSSGDNRHFVHGISYIGRAVTLIWLKFELFAQGHTMDGRDTIFCCLFFPAGEFIMKLFFPGPVHSLMRFRRCVSFAQTTILYLQFISCQR